MKCRECPDYAECVKCANLLKKRKRCPKAKMGKVKTNADRILATDDELVTMLHAVKMGYAPWCDYHCENEGDDGCDKCIKKWLKRPAE